MTAAPSKQSLLSIISHDSLPPEQQVPTRLTALPGGEWPTHVLVPWARRYIEATAASVDVPTALVAQAVLGLFAAALSGKFQVKPMSNKRWTEELNLYLLTVAATGERKSAVLSPIVNLLKQEERARKAENQEPQLEAAVKTTSLQARQSALKSAMKRAMDDAEERERLEKELLQVEVDLADLARNAPADHRILVQNVTSEALVEKMSQRRGRSAMFSAEGGMLESIANGRYNVSETDIDVYLNGYSCEVVQVDRKTSGSIEVEKGRLTINLMVQPGVVATIGKNRRLKDRGFLARFLYAAPATRVGKRFESNNPGDDVPAIEAFERNARGLLRIPDPLDEHGRLDPVTLRFDAEAEELIASFIDETERRLGPGGDLFDDAGWAGRTWGNAIRIAGILAVTDGGGAPAGNRITADVVRRAITLVRYYEGEMRPVAGAINQDELTDEAEKILRVIQRDNLRKTTKAALARLLGPKRPARNIFDDVLDLLVEHGYLVEVESTAAKKDRRRREFIVNCATVPASAPPPRSENIGAYVTGRSDTT